MSLTQARFAVFILKPLTPQITKIPLLNSCLCGLSWDMILSEREDVPDNALIFHI
jgi:hypothetical protein